MIFEKDWLMRQIKTMVQAMLKLLMNVDTDAGASYQYAEESHKSETWLLHSKLTELIESGDINEAENLLFDAFESIDSDNLIGVAMDFYNRLNDLTDEELEKQSFSRQEIADGIKDIAVIYGIDSILPE